MTHSHRSLVGIIMGSDSDLSVMSGAAKILADFGITSELRVLSAHRTPHQVAAWVEAAEHSGTQVFIAGAGVAAALPGAVAALTSRPVIGVPLMSANSAVGGLDSILAIAQMPPGVPVATVALNSAKNAGLLAAQILAIGDEEIAKKVQAYKEKMAAEIVAKDKALQEKGYKKYLEDHGN